MSQHDMSIANQGFPAFRSDLNDALQALVSQNSGATAPSTTFANMLWYDTANNLIKMRNEDNDAWVTLFEINQTTDVADIVRLAASQTLTNKTLTTPVINGFTGDTSIVNIGSGQIYKDTSGNVGVGRTPTAVAAYKMFEIDGVTGSYNKHFVNGSERSYWYTANAEVGFGTKTAVPLLFTTNDIERIRIPSDAGGITFPATQSASSDANTLDDYEEGTWTPTIGTGTASFYYPKYTKIGRVVTLSAYCDNFSDRSSSNTVAIGGLPFTYLTNSQNTGSVFIRYTNNPVSACFVAADINFYGASSGAYSPLLHSQLNNVNAQIYFQATYISES